MAKKRSNPGKIAQNTTNLIENLPKLIDGSKLPKQSKEDFMNGADWLRALVSGNVAGVKSKFMTDIYKERIMYPHEEMLLAKKAYRTNSYVQSAVNTRAAFLLGGKVEVTSEDQKLADTLNQLIRETNFSKLFPFMAKDTIVTGNGYLERIREGKSIMWYEYISFPERMYADLDDSGIIKQYLQEMPEYVRAVNFGTIRYYGDRRKTIKGKIIPKEKIVHFKLGVSEIPAYGRGPVCAITNDIEVLNEVERSVAVIARYKAIPKKLIMLNRADDTTNGGKAAEFYANQMSNLSDIENPVLPEIAQIADLSYSGKDVNFEPMVEYLSKKITVAIAPGFIMHGEETNYAVSRDQKEAFILTNQADREMISDVGKKEIRILAESRGMVVDEDAFELKFGDFDLGQNEDKKNYAKDLFQSGIITLNEAREVCGLPEDVETNGYNGELNAQATLFGTSGQVPKEGENDNLDKPTPKDNGDIESDEEEQKNKKVSGQ